MGTLTSASRNPDRDTFFAQELKDIYREEKSQLHEIKKTTENAPLHKLKEIFIEYGELTWQQISKIANLFSSLGEKPDKSQSRTIENITQEIEQGILEINYNTFTKSDILMRCQRIYHFKMILFNNAVQLAAVTKQKDIATVPVTSGGTEKKTVSNENPPLMAIINSRIKI